MAEQDSPKVMSPYIAKVGDVCVIAEGVLSVEPPTSPRATYGKVIETSIPDDRGYPSNFRAVFDDGRDLVIPAFQPASAEATFVYVLLDKAEWPATFCDWLYELPLDEQDVVLCKYRTICYGQDELPSYGLICKKCWRELTANVETEEAADFTLRLDADGDSEFHAGRPEIVSSSACLECDCRSYALPEGYEDYS